VGDHRQDIADLQLAKTPGQVCMHSAQTFIMENPLRSWRLYGRIGLLPDPNHQKSRLAYQMYGGHHTGSPPPKLGEQYGRLDYNVEEDAGHQFRHTPNSSRGLARSMVPTFVHSSHMNTSHRRTCIKMKV